MGQSSKYFLTSTSNAQAQVPKLSQDPSGAPLHFGALSVGAILGHGAEPNWDDLVGVDS